MLKDLIPSGNLTSGLIGGTKMTRLYKWSDFTSIVVSFVITIEKLSEIPPLNPSTDGSNLNIK